MLSAWQMHTHLQPKYQLALGFTFSAQIIIFPFRGVSSQREGQDPPASSFYKPALETSNACGSYRKGVSRDVHGVFE